MSNNYTPEQVSALNDIVKNHLAIHYGKPGDNNVKFEVEPFLEALYILRENGLIQYHDDHAGWLVVAPVDTEKSGQEPGVAPSYVIMNAIPYIKNELNMLLENREGDSPYIKKYLSDSEFVLFVSCFLNSVGNELEARRKSAIENFQHETEVYRKELLDGFKEDLKDVKAKLFSVGDALEKVKSDFEKNADNVVEELNDKADNIVPNMLTALGIFMAVVVAIVACYLNILLTDQTTSESVSIVFNTLTNAKIVYKYELIELLQSVFVGHLTVNVVFLLMYMIARITGRSISTYCIKGRCRSCEKCIHLSEKTHQQEDEKSKDNKTGQLKNVESKQHEAVQPENVESKQHEAVQPENVESKQHESVHPENASPEEHEAVQPEEPQDCRLWERAKNRYLYILIINGIFLIMYLLITGSLFFLRSADSTQKQPTYVAQECVSYYADAIIQIEDGAMFMSLPVNREDNDESSEIRVGDIGESVVAVRLYKNSEGEYWYEVESSNLQGYLFAGSAEPVDGTIKKGSYYSTDGHSLSRYEDKDKGERE